MNMNEHELNCRSYNLVLATARSGELWKVEVQVNGTTQVSSVIQARLQQIVEKIKIESVNHSAQAVPGCNLTLMVRTMIDTWVFQFSILVQRRASI